MKWVSQVVLLTALALTTGCAAETPEPLPPRAQNGAIDLKDWQFHRSGPIALDGEWEFWWGRLLSPDDIPASAPAPTITVPGAWNGREYGGAPLPGEGVATFRLLLKNLQTGQPMGLHLPTISTAYRLWAGGALLTETGRVGQSRATATPQNRPRVVLFEPRTSTVEIVLQVANFHHQKGGLRNPLVVGTAEQIQQRRDRAIALSLFLTGSLSIMGFYHLGLFALRPRDRSTLSFGFFCLLVAARTLFVNEVYLVSLLPWFPWELGLKIEYLGIYAGVPLFVSFFRSQFPDEMWPGLPRLSTAVAVPFCLTVLFFPARIFTLTLVAYHMVVAATIFYLLCVLLLATARRRPGALVTCAVGLVFFATTLNDILFYNGVIGTGDLTSLGLFCFIFAQSVNLSTKFSRAFRAAEELSANLHALNSSLEEKVQERTRLLAASQRQVAATLAAVSVLEERNRIAREIHNAVGHALTTTTVVIEAAKRLMRRDPDQAEARLERAQTLVRQGMNSVRQTVHSLEESTHGDGFSRALGQLVQESADDTGVTVSCDIEPLHHLTPGQYDVLYQALQEGITNGIRHGGADRFHLLLRRVDGAVHFRLTDNGKGSDAGGFGFGLRTLESLARGQNGRLRFRSASEGGSVLEIDLPAGQPGETVMPLASERSS